MTSPEITDAAGPLPWDADVDLPEGEQPRANDATGLLPCPFCGGVPHLASEAYSDENPAEVIAPAVINCSGCPATIVESWADEAIASWNRRARAAGVPGEIPDAAVEAAKRRIILEIQLYDFGHTDAEGNFTTTAQKIDLLEERAGKAARAALTAALPHLAAGCTEAVAAGWQTMDTAPKDGTFIRSATEARNHNGFEILRFPYPLTVRWNGEKWEADDGRTYDPQPTHWRRLPGSALVSAPAATPSKMQSIRAPYTNWRGERANRVFTPIRVWWGSIEWHPEPGLMLKAFDHDKQAERDFAFSGFAAPSPSQEALREALATLGWNACRKSLYAVCEDVDREAEETCRKATDDGSSEYVKGHVEGYRAGMLRAAKSIARGFNAMEALDDDNLTAALAQSAPVKGGE